MNPQTVREAFREQARACAALGSPFTARLLEGLADRMQPGAPVADKVLGWQGDASYRADSVALRLAGGLHALARSGRDPALARIYSEPAVAEDEELLAAALGAIAADDGFLLDGLDSPPQTNEVRRSAVLIAAGHWLAARFGLPLVLSELGASAGLNLMWDHYALDLPGALRLGPADPVLVLEPEWRGDPPPAAAPQVIDRAGVDLTPLDPVDDRLRLMSYIWADQTDRLQRTARALDLAAEIRPALTRGDAAEWLEARLAAPRPGALHLVFHTVAWQYFLPATKARAGAALARAGAVATPEAPLARLGMEADATPGSAALTLTLWPGGQVIPLGRADFHGRRVDWTAPAP